MGKIFVDFSNRMTGKPSIFIERTVDEHETQKLRFTLEKNSWLGTETGDAIHLFGKDNGNTIEVHIPISVRDLKEALDEFLGVNK